MERPGGLRRKAHRSLYIPSPTGRPFGLSTKPTQQSPTSVSTINGATMRLCRADLPAAHEPTSAGAEGRVVSEAKRIGAISRQEKSEYRNSKQIQSMNLECSKLSCRCFGHSNFEIASCFGFRISLPCEIGPAVRERSSRITSMVRLTAPR